MRVYIHNESGQGLLGESIDETLQINVHGCKDGLLWLEEGHELCVDGLGPKFTRCGFLREIQSFLELHRSVFAQDKSWWEECPVEESALSLMQYGICHFSESRKRTPEQSHPVRKLAGASWVGHSSLGNGK